MANKLIIVLCALAFGIGIVLWDTNVPSDFSEDSPNAQREEISNFFFTSLDGRNHNLHDFHGKILFINGWFSRCPPCVKEMPEFLELAHKHPDDMVFIALSVDKSKADMLRYIESLPEKTHALTKLDNVFFVHDEGKVISQNLLKIRGFPETVIIDREGRKLYKIHGVIDWLGPKVEKIFSKHSLPDEQDLIHTHDNAL